MIESQKQEADIVAFRTHGGSGFEGAGTPGVRSGGGKAAILYCLGWGGVKLTQDIPQVNFWPTSLDSLLQSLILFQKWQKCNQQEALGLL